MEEENVVLAVEIKYTKSVIDERDIYISNLEQKIKVLEGKEVQDNSTQCNLEVLDKSIEDEEDGDYCCFQCSF